MEKIIFTERELPVIALRGLVLVPHTPLQFDVGRKQSLAALKYAMEHDQMAFFSAQKDLATETPPISDLYEIGTVGKIRHIIRSSEQDVFRVVVEGICRAVVYQPTYQTDYLSGLIRPLDDKPIKPSSQDVAQGLMRRAKNLFFHYLEYVENMVPEAIYAVEKCNQAEELADLIVGSMFADCEEKQKILDELDPLRRLEKVCVLLMNERHLMEIEAEIDTKLQDKMDQGQREYYLHEQMKVIAEELGETDNPLDEYEKYRQKIAACAMPDESKQKLYEEAGRLRAMASTSPDANVIRAYLDRCLALPWGIYTKDNLNLAHARKVLDARHYGLDEIKERILELIAARAFAPDIHGQIICFAGPPGVGKTSVVKSIAEALGRKYQRIALGGVRDEAEIRGHRRTYIGAMPGRIMSAVSDAGSSNPVILLDEIDKISSDYKGDPASALLEALDGEQNNTFTDHYIDLPFDLSKVLFITTANDKYSIPDALLDRMEVIDLYSYTAEEKFHIAKKHLLKKQMQEHNLTAKNLRVTDKALRLIIEGYTREAGVRQLERQLAKICRKTTVRLTEDPDRKIVVDPKNLTEFLGQRKFREPEDAHEDRIGLVNGLAWTSVGGEILQVETAVLDGSGKVELTGSLGDVMKESARAAITCVRSRAENLGIEKDFYKTKDIHIHFPEGAVPKDGPSAGVTITTCLVSALSSVPVSGTVAMTGEVTLRGRVLPIGGLKEKAMAAYKAGMKKVIIPFDNLPDLEKVDAEVKNGLTFLPVKTVDEVLEYALVKKKEPKPEAKVKKEYHVPEKNQPAGKWAN